jgi:flagellar protein FlaG
MDILSLHHAGHALPAVTAPSPTENLAQNREVIQAVKAVNAAELLGQNNELTFLFDRDTQRPIIRLVDRKTGAVIRQIPPEYVLRMAEDLARRP